LYNEEEEDEKPCHILERKCQRRASELGLCNLALSSTFHVDDRDCLAYGRSRIQAR